MDVEKGHDEPSTLPNAILPENHVANALPADRTRTAAEPASEKDVGVVDDKAQESFSVFSIKQKRLIVLTASFAGFFSPLTGSIYYPAITDIANDLHTTTDRINLTVTTYLIIQGLAPMMIAGFSDKMGRRPAYVICFTIYMIANLGLGLQNNYIALLVLRMVQSGGSSGTIALAQGVVGDVITSSERGAFIAITSISSILGPTLSPILGGILSQYLGWHSVFWCLLIMSVAFFVPFILYMPETCRNIVGDGSIPPPRLNSNLTDSKRFRNRRDAGIPIDQLKLDSLRKNYKFGFPNPLRGLVVFTDLESVLVLIPCGLSLACFYAISTGASAAFADLYGFDALHVSLMFLPLGAGGILSAFTTGRLVDYNFRRHARRLNFPVERNKQTDLIAFPIERARLEIAFPFLLLGAAGVLGYAWALNQAHVSLAAPIILLLLMGWGLTAAFQVLNVLLIDIYPGRPATVTAANNIVRCELGAAATAAIGSMTAAMGNGWAYTLLALIFLVSLVPLFLVMRVGMKWRQAKRVKEDERKEREKMEEESNGGMPQGRA